MSESDDPGDFDPADAGKELSNPNETNAEDDNETETMSQNRPTPKDESNDQMTAQKPAEAINGFAGLYPRFTGQDMATVLSLRNGDVSAYRVNISTLECWGPSGTECPDNEFNKNGEPVEGYMGAEVCDHIACAIHAAPKKPDLGIKTVDGMIQMLGETKSAAEAAHNTAKVIERANGSHANAKASQTPSDSDVAEREPEGQQSNANADEKREKLQAAFDDATSGMDTQVHAGKVWVNKTPDAPDWTFDAFLKNADQVNYDPDADSPGQYWKNYVEPGDVDEYISEVLS